MSIPRLTTALRSFSSVTPDYAKPGSKSKDDIDRELSFKRQRRAERQLAEKLSWKQLTDLVHDLGRGGAQGKNLDTELKTLIKEARVLGTGTILTYLFCFTYGIGFIAGFF